MKDPKSLRMNVAQCPDFLLADSSEKREGGKSRVKTLSLEVPIFQSVAISPGKGLPP